MGSENAKMIPISWDKWLKGAVPSVQIFNTRLQIASQILSSVTG